MVDYSPKRRRRGPAKAAAAPVVLAEVMPGVTAAAPEPSGKRRRRASVGGHAMKLTAPDKPGFTRRFFNDSGNRLADAKELGYEFVSDKGIKTSSPGSRVSRLVGTEASGEPLQSFLMETPDELYAEGIAEREAIHRQVDQAIVKGADATGNMTSEDGAYGHGQIHVER